MLPITGPYSSDVGYGTLGQGSYRTRKTGYRQAKPYDLPLAYTRIDEWLAKCDIIGDQPPPPWTNVWVGSSLSWLRGLPKDRDNPLAVAAVNEARKRFVNLISDRANLAYALIEREQTMSMLTNRLTQVAHWANAVRRGRFHDAYRILRHDHEVDRRTSPTIPAITANLWLQYWFGLSPLISDIASAMRILNTPFGVRPLVAKASVSDSGTYSTRIYGNFGYQDLAITEFVKAHCRIQAEVWIDNPNIFLGARLGFTNPLIIGYEAIPFSFIANWFVNVEEYLHQFSDFHGITVVKPQNVVSTKTLCNGSDLTVFYSGTTYGVITEGHSHYLNRVTSIPDVELAIRLPWRLSASRAATAASLVVTLFGAKSNLFGKVSS